MCIHPEVNEIHIRSWRDNFKSSAVGMFHAVSSINKEDRTSSSTGFQEPLLSVPENLHLS